MKTELLQVTPEIANKLLQRNLNNRNLSDRLVSKYEQDMRGGNWTITHQGIAFYEDGTLADGQHRLAAIIRSGVPISMYVTRGLKREQAINIDMNRPRSVIDGIKIGELSDWIEARHITMCGVITHPKRLSTNEMVDFLERIKPSAQFVTEVFASNRRYLTPSVIHAGLCIAHHNGEKPALLARFSDVLATGVAEHQSERVAILAREAFFHNINNGAADKKEKYLKMQKAIYAYCHGETIKRLTIPKEEIYTFKGLF
jgi:hypothetical protein